MQIISLTKKKIKKSARLGLNVRIIQVESASTIRKYGAKFSNAIRKCNMEMIVTRSKETTYHYTDFFVQTINL